MTIPANRPRQECHMEGHMPIWGPVGTRDVNWHGQIAALLRDGYRGYLSPETHWPGPPKADGSAPTNSSPPPSAAGIFAASSLAS